MADIKKFVHESGRRVEQHVTENAEATMPENKIRVTETYMEKVPMVLHERITEKVVPVVTSRKKEQYTDGELINTSVEQVEDKTLQLYSTQHVLTKEDVEEVVNNTLEKKLLNFQHVSTPKKVRTKPKVNILKQAVQETEQETVSTNKSDIIETILYIVLAIETGFIVYNLFLKNWI